MKRVDLFQDRKCIHIRLEKDVHTAFRQLMFEYGLSMQEIINEFARRASEKDPKAIKIIDQYAKFKIDEQLKKLQSPVVKKANEKVSELDHDTLYDLIEEK